MSGADLTQMAPRTRWPYDRWPDRSTDKDCARFERHDTTAMPAAQHASLPVVPKAPTVRPGVHPSVPNPSGHAPVWPYAMTVPL